MIPSAARDSWQELVARLRPFIARRVPASDEVDDVLQDVFVKMQRHLRALREDERFGAWLYRVARSAIADRRRARARHPLAQEPDDDSREAVALAADAPRDLEPELLGCLALFVARLPSPYREAVTLTELEGLSQREAAEMLGLSVSGMKSRVQRGREKLRSMFEACCEIAIDARGRVISCEPRTCGCDAPAAQKRG